MPNKFIDLSQVSTISELVQQEVDVVDKKIDYRVATLNNEINNKVTKVTGKGLSTKDYTVEDQTIVKNIQYNNLSDIQRMFIDLPQVGDIIALDLDNSGNKLFKILSEKNNGFEIISLFDISFVHSATTLINPTYKDPNESKLLKMGQYENSDLDTCLTSYYNSLSTIAKQAIVANDSLTINAMGNNTRSSDLPISYSWTYQYNSYTYYVAFSKTYCTVPTRYVYAPSFDLVPKAFNKTSLNIEEIYDLLVYPGAQETDHAISLRDTYIVASRNGSSTDNSGTRINIFSNCGVPGPGDSSTGDTRYTRACMIIDLTKIPFTVVTDSED